MADKQMLKLIENHKESKGIFRIHESKMSSPIKSQMAKFMHSNEQSRKDILPGFLRFKPEDLK